MASNIDTAIPPFGNPTTAGVRQNFVAAKEEIEDLQTAKVLRLQHVNDSVKTLQQITASNTQQVIIFNQELFNNGGIYTFDSINNEVVFAEPGWYQASINFHVERQLVGAAVDFLVHTELKTPEGEWTDFPASMRVVTLDGAVANHKDFRAVAFVSNIQVANTRMRFLQAVTDHTKVVGICSYPAFGVNLPGAAGISFSVHKISEDL